MSESTTVVHGSSPVEVYKPRSRLLIDGKVHPETPLYNYHITRTRFSRTDTASITCVLDMAAVKALPGDPWFAPKDTTTAPAPVEVELQFRDETDSNATWTSIFIGIMDEATVSFPGNTVSIECRDYMQKLMDMRVSSAWLNKSAHELLVSIIEAAGLTADVAPLSDLAGKYWQIEHKHLSTPANTKFQTAYELARYVANTQQCDLYADGKTIRVKPFPKVGDGTVTHTRALKVNNVGTVSGAFTSLSFQRNFMLAKSLIVHVLTWDGRQRTRHEIFWSATGVSKTSANTTGMLYSYMLPGLTLNQLKTQAKMLYDMLSRHLVVVQGEMRPGSKLVVPREFFTLSGTGWMFDNTYTVDSVQTIYDPTSGFLQSLQMRVPELSSQQMEG